MFHVRRLCEEGADDRAPLRERRRFTKPNRVVLQRVPADHQQVALGRLDALLDLMAEKSIGMRDHAAHAMLDRGVELGLTAGLDANIGNFENHRVVSLMDGSATAAVAAVLARQSYNAAFLPAGCAMPLTPIPEIVAELRAGRMVVLVDEEDRENEGDLVLAAEHVTPEAINFMVTHARGLVCLTLTRARCAQIGLKPMVQHNGSVHGTAFTVSIEAAEGVSTGISAADRALTVRAAVAQGARAEDIVQPGHVFPLMAQDGGVLMRAGHTEAGCDLAALAGLEPAAVICEIMNDDGTMARLPDLERFADRHGLKIGAIADLIEYRSRNESLIERASSRALRTPWGGLQAVLYRDRASGGAHLALVHGTPHSAVDPVLVRVHEPLSVLDVLEADGSGHSWSLPRALQRVVAAEAGVVVLINAGESAATLLDRFDAAAAPTRGAAAALRTYGIGAQILRDLGVRRMRLLAAPRKMPSMTGFGLEIDGFEPPPESTSEQPR